jgi:hypothetical protein
MKPNVTLGMVINSRGEVNSEAVQKTVIRHVF